MELKSVITAILRNFSSSNNNSKWEFYGAGRLEKLQWYVPSLYANGNCKENVGYVSIVYNHKFRNIANTPVENTELRCYVSVVDVAGKKRFEQSVVCFYGNINPLDLRRGFQFGFERYLRRETLLNDPDELLPGECLTLCINVELIFHFDHEFASNFLRERLLNLHEITFTDEGGTVWISLDKKFGRDLCDVSQYFRRASDTPMIEGKIRRVRIEKEEEKVFERIFYIFYGLWSFAVESVGDIWDLYRVADKYDIQPVIRTCRQFVEAVLCMAENLKCQEYVNECVSEILELADQYQDDEIKEAVEIFFKRKQNLGTNEYADEQHLERTQNGLYTLFNCKFVEGNTSVPPSFLLTRVGNPKLEFYE